MIVENYIPADRLQPFVKIFLIIESEQETENRLLPDTSVVLAFRLKGSIIDHTHDGTILPLSAITGLRRSQRVLSYAGKTANLLVIFREGAAAAFFKQPLHELFAKSVPLDEFIPRGQVQQIEERLNGAQHNRQRIGIIEDFLLTKLDDRRTDRLIGHAIQKIRVAKGDIRIKNLVSNLPISLDPFEKRFRRTVGISPKQFADTIRLRNLIQHYSVSTSLTDTALTSGYFDQAHFIKDFQAFTGLAPKQFFKNARWW